MPDFSKIWASASPLPAYSFTDEEYTEGWDFVGSAPPTKNQFDAWFRYTDERLKWLYDKLMTSLYPVGSVYISFNSTDPSSLFGGTWVRLKDRFLLASGDTYAPGTTGGSATKTITKNNLPAHNHTVNSAGTHNHTRGSMNITGTFPLPSEATASANDHFVGAFAKGETTTGRWSSDQNKMGSMLVNFDSSTPGAWTGSTSSNGSHTHTTNNTGSGLPLNVMPPYQTVYAWRRTA